MKSSVPPLCCWKQGYQVEGLFMKNWDEDAAADTDHRDGRSGGMRRAVKRQSSPISSAYG